MWPPVGAVRPSQAGLQDGDPCLQLFGLAHPNGQLQDRLAGLQADGLAPAREGEDGQLLGLVREVFPPIRHSTVYVSKDPDGGNDTIVVGWQVSCEVREALAAYNRFVKRWVEASSWETRKRIRVSYTVSTR